MSWQDIFRITGKNFAPDLFFKLIPRFGGGLALYSQITQMKNYSLIIGMLKNTLKLFTIPIFLNPKYFKPIKPSSNS